MDILNFVYNKNLKNILLYIIMSSNVQYKKNRVDNFIAMYNNYTNAIDEYKSDLDTFVTTFQTVLTNYNAADDSNIVGVYKNSSNNQHFILTSENILMKVGEEYVDAGVTINSLSPDLTDASLNSLFELSSGTSVFFTDVPYEGEVTALSVGESNKFVQIGLSDLSYNQAESNTALPYEFPGTKTPTLSRTMNWGDMCTGEDINRCDAYAKFTNTPYYGLGHNSGVGATGNACDCYMISDAEYNTLTEIQSKVVLLDTNDSFKNKMLNSKYLGILMDGNMYGLKELVYNNNFDNFYEKNDGKIEKLTSQVVHTDCHPFTGTGVNTIEIGSLGENVCALKS